MSGKLTTDSHRPAAAARRRMRTEEDARPSAVNIVEGMIALAVGTLAPASPTLPPAKQSHPNQEHRLTLQGARARHIHLPYDMVTIHPRGEAINIINMMMARAGRVTFPD
jgi:hypothetical protein